MSYKDLPRLAGVYLFKDNADGILYIGKAKNIKNRVASYFKKYATDWKIKTLVDEHKSIDYILTQTEHEALLLEAQLIQKHKPKFNVLLKEGQPFLYLLFTNQELPELILARNKEQDGEYIGPFLHKQQARAAHRFLIRTFQLFLCNKNIPHGCLDYHLGFCAGVCRNDFDKEEYLFRLTLAHDALKKNQQGFLQKIHQQMALYNAQLRFEQSRSLNRYLQDLSFIFQTINSRFSPEKYASEILIATTPREYVAKMPADIAQQLQKFLQTNTAIHTIDCFDISHMQSKQMVGACIRFNDGIPQKNKFRRFIIKTLTTQDDYAALQEIVRRRYKNNEDIPDLILIDGGKGQLNAILSILPHALCASLAKREETIFLPYEPFQIKVNIATPVGMLLIALRDYTHHFAVTFHKLRKKKAFLK